MSAAPPARGTEGKGSRSGLSLQGCSYHQQSPAPAGNGTGHCPQARVGSWGARAAPLQLPKRCVSHAGTRRGGQDRPPVRAEELQPRPGAGQSPSVCPQLGTSDSFPRSHLSGTARQEEEGGGGSGAGMPRRADSTEPQTAKINKEAGDRVRSRPVPKSPGLPLQPLRALPAPAGARGKDGLSQLDEDICIKLIKKTKQNPKTKPNPNPVRVRDVLPSFPALPGECVRDTLARQTLALGRPAGESQRCRFHLADPPRFGASLGGARCLWGQSPAPQALPAVSPS